MSWLLARLAGLHAHHQATSMPTRQLVREDDVTHRRAEGGREPG
jgi:hypothetical protein